MFTLSFYFLLSKTNKKYFIENNNAQFHETWNDETSNRTISMPKCKSFVVSYICKNYRQAHSDNRFPEHLLKFAYESDYYPQIV